MATCTELYIDTSGGLDLDGSTDKNLPYFVVENLATLDRVRLIVRTCSSDREESLQLGFVLIFIIFIAASFARLPGLLSIIIPAKAFAKDYVITGVGLSDCLSVCSSVCLLPR